MPQISVRGLAKYMAARPAQQLKVLRDYKFPSPEGTAQAGYYQPARDFIKESIRRGQDSEWLLRKAVSLEAQATSAVQQRRTKLLSNASAIRGFAANFGSRRLVLLDAKRFRLRHGGVTVTVSPELHVTERGEERVILLGMPSIQDDAQTRVMLQCTADAIEQERLPIRRSSVRYWDCHTGQEVKGTDRRTRLAADIEASCQTIDAIWPTI